MSSIFLLTLISLINAIGIIYAMHQFLKHGQKFFNRKTLPYFLITIIILALQYALFDTGIRSITVSLSLIIVFSLMFKEEKLKSVILSYFFAFLLYLVADILGYLLLVQLMGFDIKMLTDVNEGMLASSLFTNGFVVLASSYRRISRYLSIVVKELEPDTIIAILSSLLIEIIIIIFLWEPFAEETNKKIDLLPFLVLMTVYMFASFYIVVQKQVASKKTNENKNLIRDLEKNEQIINQQFKLNHDNKNDLITIKGMVENKDKNLKEFLDVLIKEKLEGNSSVLNRTAQIPSGGLRGIIYLKTLDAEKKHIEVSITTSENIYKFDATKNPKTNRDLCKIIGILLDNAIEATENAEKRFISINMTLKDEQMVISITNSYFGTIDLSKVDEVNYSTKGTKRGYGLSNVKDIIDHNKDLTNERRIDGSTFTQIIKIKV